MTKKQVVASTTMPRMYYIVCNKHNIEESPRFDKVDTYDSGHCMSCCEDCYSPPYNRDSPCWDGIMDWNGYMYQLRKQMGITKPNKLHADNKEDFDLE